MCIILLILVFGCAGLADSNAIELPLWNIIKVGQNPADIKAYIENYAQVEFVALDNNLLQPLVNTNIQQTANSEIQSAKECAYCPEMIKLPTGIWMGKYEVTQGQWLAVMDTNPSNFKNCGKNCPVEQVSLNDVQDFIKKLNANTGNHYRLPSEDEWLTACQAGIANSLYCGSNDLNDIAWFTSNSKSSTHPYGQKQPNAWGFFDMSGNVWEWTKTCSDAECSLRVLRGGSWNDKPSGMVRYVTYPVGRNDDIGFRLAQY